MAVEDHLKADLAYLEARHRLRATTSYAGPDHVHVEDEHGTPLLSFCSNDYLGLASHPALSAAAATAIARYGFGAAASRLISGQTAPHLTLERDLAAFLDYPDTRVFPTGYQTNLGVLTALAGREDLIVSDAANHASIIDGCRLSRAQVAIFPHGDAQAAATALATAKSFRRRLLVTESLFSMDGDRAPLAALAQACRDHGALLIVDEAHAVGTLGPGGRGLCAELSVHPDVLIGTLGKAFGSLGGFAAGSAAMCATLTNRARSFIYTTAAPPALAAAAAAALHLIDSAEGQLTRASVHALAARARAGLAGLGLRALGRDLILPVVVGSEAAVLEMSTALLTHGILVPSIRPPTVPEGSCRLRITVSARHTPADVDRLLSAFKAIGRRRLSISDNVEVLSSP